MNILYTDSDESDDCFTMLYLEPVDFQHISKEAVMKIRGHRFKYLLIPKGFVEYIKKEPTFEKIKTTLMTGTKMRAEIITY